MLVVAYIVFSYFLKAHNPNTVLFASANEILYQNQLQVDTATKLPPLHSAFENVPRKNVGAFPLNNLGDSPKVCFSYISCCTKKSTKIKLKNSNKNTFFDFNNYIPVFVKDDPEVNQ